MCFIFRQEPVPKSPITVEQFRCFDLVRVLCRIMYSLCYRTIKLSMNFKQGAIVVKYVTLWPKWIANREEIQCFQSFQTNLLPIPALFGNMQSSDTEINATFFFGSSSIIRFEFMGDQCLRTGLFIANPTMYNLELFSDDSGYLTYIIAFNLLQTDQCVWRAMRFHPAKYTIKTTFWILIFDNAFLLFHWNLKHIREWNHWNKIPL